jgi:hypothetical protein
MIGQLLLEMASRLYWQLRESSFVGLQFQFYRLEQESMRDVEGVPFVSASCTKNTHRVNSSFMHFAIFVDQDWPTRFEDAIFCHRKSPQRSFRYSLLVVRKTSLLTTFSSTPSFLIDCLTESLATK